MAELDEQWEKLQGMGPNLGVRSLFSFAHAAAEAGSHAQEIETAYEMAAAMQDRDAASSTYGNFRWYEKNPAPRDLNAVEFCVNTAIVTWIQHRDALTEKARGLLEELLRYSAEGIKGHKVLVTYTNIMLKRSFNAMAVGERMGMSDLAEEGYASFDRWYAYTQAHGIHEYLSPTYYRVDLGVLDNIVTHVERADVKERGLRALNYLWCDIAANWFSPCNRLGGAHSRDYDYLRGDSSGIHVMLTSLLGNPASEDGIDRGTLKALVETVPRFVHQSWGDQPGQTASQYVGRTFSVGSSDASRHNMDKVLTVNLAGDPDTPMLTFLMDGRGDPYGVNPVEEDDGHTKSRHLLPFVTSVQREGEVLLLASAGPIHWEMLSEVRKNNDVPNPLQTTGLSFDASGKPIRLLSHLTFPLDAVTRIGTKEIDTKALGEHEIGDAVVTMRLGETVVGIRVAAALRTDGTPAEARLVVDASGLAHGVGRITVIHDDDAPETRGTVALWVRAVQKDDAGDLLHEMKESGASFEGDRATVSVKGLKGEMKLVADLGTFERLEAIGRDPEADGAVLWVNGRDIGKDLLT